MTGFFEGNVTHKKAFKKQIPISQQFSNVIKVMKAFPKSLILAKSALDGKRIND